MKKLLKKLQGKNERLAYMFFQEVLKKSEVTNEFYFHFEDFVFLMNQENLNIRIRGFALCCAQARWDEQGKIQSIFPKLLEFLKDDNPVIAKQCLGIFKEVVLYRPELHPVLIRELKDMDLTKYGDVMAVTVQKRVEWLLEIIEEQAGS